MKLPRWAAIGTSVVLFLLAFFLRAYRPISRPDQWLARSWIFCSALGRHDWAATYQSRHPGFTTMVISGTTLCLYDEAAGTPLQNLFTWGVFPFATDMGREMAIGVLGLSIVLSALIVAIALAIRKLAGWPMALAAAGLMAFAPAYLAESRVLHVDALVSTLMLLSALLLLVSLQAKQRRYLVLSGVVGGLALLTKTPALFLLPYTGLALLVYLLCNLRNGWRDHAKGWMGWLLGETWRGLVFPLLLWVVMVALPFAFWPAMWVNPTTVLGNMMTGTLEHVVNPHVYPRFFNGHIYTGAAPGPLFYPTILAFNASFITFVLFLVSLVYYVLRRRNTGHLLPPITFWLLVAYVAFFTIQMTIGAKQSDRYEMPAQLMLEVLAAAGLAAVADLVQRALADLKLRLAQAVVPILLAAAIGLQALVALAFMPDYGAHYNYLFGGNQGAVHVVEFTGQNEGIAYLGDYMSHVAGERLPSLAVSYPLNTSIRQYYAGETFYPIPHDADYYAFNLVTLQRQMGDAAWWAAWERFAGASPQMVVSFDGVDYLWLYAANPGPRDYEMVIRRGWAGFTGIAWGVTFAFLGVFIWALRRTKGETAEKVV